MLQQSSAGRDHSAQYIANIVLLVTCQSTFSPLLHFPVQSSASSFLLIFLHTYLTEMLSMIIAVAEYFVLLLHLPSHSHVSSSFLSYGIYLQYTEFKAPCILHSLVRSNLQVPQEHCKGTLSRANVHICLCFLSWVRWQKSRDVKCKISDFKTSQQILF